MNTKISTSGIVFGFAVFVGLMPLTFMFSQNGTQFLLDTSFKYAVWCGQVIILILLLLKSNSLDKNQIMALVMLYLFVPFTFTFNESGVSFLILNKYTSSILSWAVASVLLSKLLFLQKLKANANL
jgi:hypothetical protein